MNLLLYAEQRGQLSNLDVGVVLFVATLLGLKQQRWRERRQRGDCAVVDVLIPLESQGWVLINSHIHGFEYIWGIYIYVYACTREYPYLFLA